MIWDSIARAARPVKQDNHWTGRRPWKIGWLQLRRTTNLRVVGTQLYLESNRLPPPADQNSLDRKRGRLLRSLRKAGIRGWPDHMTLFTGHLPPGCRVCHRGSGTCLRITRLCDSNCFFCFNPQSRKDNSTLLGSVPVGAPAQALSLIRRHRLEGIGISGGDPLLVPKRTLLFIRTLRRRLGPGFHMHLYTSGALATEKLLAQLKKAGLNGIRFNLVASGYRLEPVRRALARFSDVTVEIPVLPDGKDRLRKLILELDHMGVPNLNLHELSYLPANCKDFLRRGYCAKPLPVSSRSLKRPVSGSEETALELLLFAKRNARRLSVYYCSRTTHVHVIEPNGRRWRESGRVRARRGASAQVSAGVCSPLSAAPAGS